MHAQPFSPVGLHDPLIGSRRMALYGMDEAVCRNIQVHQAFVMGLMPEVLDRFYDHLGHFPELDRFFGGTAHIEHIKARQLIHWERLTSAVFDDVYAESVARVGEAHFRIGLSPKLYIACYNVILRQLSMLIRERHAGAFPAEGEAGLSQLIADLTMVLMYDMECAISVYVDQASSIFI